MVEDGNQEEKVMEMDDVAVMSLISRFTIFKNKNLPESEGGINLGMFPFVGVIVGIVMLIALTVLFIIDDKIVGITPFVCIVAIAIPMFVYAFKGTAGLMRLSGSFYQEDSNSVGPAGLMIPVLVVLLMYSMYLMIGTGMMFYFVPALEVAVTFSLVTMLFFSKKCRDQRFSAASGMSGLVTAAIISVIAGVAFAGIALLLMDSLEYKLIIAIVLMFGVAFGVGFLSASLSDKYTEGMDGNVFGASMELSRALIAIVSALLFAIIFT